MLKTLIDINQQQVITLIGSGGKTTTMYYLAALAVKAGLRVLVTTTTKIFYLPEDVNRFIQASTYAEWENKLLQSSKNDYIVSGLTVQNGKIIGVPADWIDRLSLRGVVDLIFVEGDGSARKPLKAPREGEPVVPDSTTLLLPVIGLQAIYKPFNPDIVHREGIFRELTGLSVGEQICPADIFQIFVHPKGYHLVDYLSRMTVIPILNQADNLYQEEIGLELADLFIKSGITQVILASHIDNQVKWRLCSC